jgi:predicted GH43/DUF377 family glycosyl hydrolase
MNPSIRRQLRRPMKLIFIVCFSTAFILAVSGSSTRFALPFGTLARILDEPLLSPLEEGYESAGVFNPTVIKEGHDFVMIYRAQDRKGTSRLGYAMSSDGVHFTRRQAPVMTPEEEYENGGGLEDPRVVKIGDEYLLTYTGYNNLDGQGPDGKDAQLCLATSHDLVRWKRQGVIMPAYQGKWNIGWTKSGAILTSRVRGKYWMYYLGDARELGSQMGLAVSDDLRHWSDATAQPVLRSRPGTFDSRVVEPGPPPILLPGGILLIYNGADDRLVYRTGWVLFDKEDPTRVLARAEHPLFEPELEWEKTGQVPNVVFVEGLVREPNRWLFYYGAADTFIGAAAAPTK